MAKNRPFHKFTVDDVFRILDSMRISHRTTDHRLMNAVLHAFGIKDVVCAVINAFQLFQTVGLITLLYTLVKLLKGLIVVYNLMRGASLKIIKASLFLISIDLSAGILSKVALRFAALSAGLDVLLAIMALYADLMVAISPLVQFIALICDDDEDFKSKSEPVLFALEAIKISGEISDKQNELGDSIQVIDDVTNGL